MNDLEKPRRAVLPWQRSLAQPVTAGCNSTPRILAGLATLIKAPPRVSSPSFISRPLQKGKKKNAALRLILITSKLYSWSRRVAHNRLTKTSPHQNLIPLPPVEHSDTANTKAAAAEENLKRRRGDEKKKLPKPGVDTNAAEKIGEMST